MATITPGTNGTFQSATAEGQAIEALVFLQGRETTAQANPTGENRIIGSFDTDTKTFSGSFRLPATQTINGQGQLVIAAQAYLNGGTFTPGVEGTFKSTTIEAYCLEVLMYLQFLESQSAKNPNNRNFVTGSYNADQATYSGTFSLPIEISIGQGGAVNITASDYLLT